MVLWGEFEWQNATSGFPTNTASPTNFSLPWTYSLGNFVQGVQTIGAGVTAYFQGSGTGWTGTANTTDSLILTGDTNASVFVKLWILRLN
jgi:hypothetical protein